MKKTGIGLAQALKNVQNSKKVLRVGIIESATYPDGESVAQVAYKNEYGEANVPSRPFFRKTIRDNQAGWSLSVKKLLASTQYDVDNTLSLLGEHIKGQLVQTINDWSTPPNAKETIAKKGFNKPLIDTTLMRDSINYEVSEDES